MQKQLRAKKLLYQISSLYNIILFHQRLEYFIYTAFFSVPYWDEHISSA